MDRNKTTSNGQLAEQWLDAATSEALGANPPADSAAYKVDLAAAAPAAHSADRELREAVAMLAAASPYMEPPADLRGKILQASAPAAFRMEDYRKANREPGRFYRWGFYAAMLCLMLGAWYNLSLRNQLNSTVASANAQLNVRNIAFSDAISGLISPKAKQVALIQNNKVFAKAFVNDSTKTAVLLLPKGLIPDGQTINEITLTDEENKPVVYRTIAIPTDRAAFPQVASDDKLNVGFKAQNVQPDPNQKIYTAQMH